MTGDLILALDVGTSSAKAALYDARGRRVGKHLSQFEYAPIVDNDGRFELAPKKVLAAVRGCIGETLTWYSKRQTQRRIAAVATSCFWHSMIGTDAHGRALTPIYTWADTRPQRAAHKLREKWDEHSYHQRTGCMFHASFWPARHLWLHTTARPLYQSVARWLAPGEWLVWQLTGSFAAADGMATGTGIYNPNTRAWDEVTLARLPIPERTLAPLEPQPTPTGRAARRWPALANAVWLPPIGDGIASNLGSGATATPYAAINYGTSAALRLVKTGPASAPHGLFAYRIDGKRFLQGGAISNAGNLYAWARRTLNLPTDNATLDRALARQTRRPHGLVVLPFWHGERAPYWRDDLRGTIHGITGSTTALEIACALREASFHRLALIADQLPGARRRIAIVSGGLTADGVQTLADVTGLRVCLAAESQAPLRGAAVHAWQQLGEEQHIEAPKLGPVVIPVPDRVRLFRRERARQTTLETHFQGQLAGELS